MKRVLKWIGIIFGGLLGIVLLFLAGSSIASAQRLGRTYEVTADFVLTVPDDAASIAAGERQFSILCAGCHGENLGGESFSDDALFGKIYSANLTAGAGGLGSVYSDEDFARAIWYGVKADGSPTVGMPFELNQALTVDEMENLIAYIRSVPGVDSNHPEKEHGPLLAVMHVTNAFPLVTAELVDLDAAPPQAVDTADVLAHGEHLAVWCTACHGVNFAGMDMMGMTTPNITASESGIGSWTEDEFSRAVREGQRPDGSMIDAEGMPWQEFSHFSDAEVHAIWTYLQSVESVETE